MAGRGVLIKPWLFREASGGYEDITPEDRLAIYRRYVDLALEHWGEDEHGLTRVREFVAWHLGFWCRYAPRRADGTWPGMQTRESAAFARSPLEALLARGDEAAIAWLTDRLVARDAVDPAEAPAPSAAPGRPGDRDEAAEG
jgi:tRNA-dihydrouridine synthase 3